jgi:recombinational DNA repair protein (RecF pathway)
MTKTVATTIIVLKKIPYQESSLIVSSISAEYGKVDFIVKGARRITKKKQPIVDLFRELNIEYRESRVVYIIQFPLIY